MPLTKRKYNLYVYAIDQAEVVDKRRSSMAIGKEKWFIETSIHKVQRNSYFYIEKWTFKIMCEVCYRAKRDKKEASWF